jgi:hypothetical protein
MNVDIDLFVQALDDHSGTTDYYFDRETGEILQVFEDGGEDLRAQVERDRERYLFIDPMPPREGFELMEAFVALLPPSEERRTLERVLTWKKPFGNFKNALYQMPELREQWFAFHDYRLAKYALGWLALNGVVAEPTEPLPEEPPTPTLPVAAPAADAGRVERAAVPPPAAAWAVASLDVAQFEAFTGAAVARIRPLGRKHGCRQIVLLREGDGCAGLWIGADTAEQVRAFWEDAEVQALLDACGGGGTRECRFAERMCEIWC